MQQMTHKIVERMPGNLKISKGSIVYLGIQGFEDELVPLPEHGGWIRLEDTWSCFPEKKLARRAPCGFGMIGYEIITPAGVRCIILYDGRSLEEFPMYIQRLF